MLRRVKFLTRDSSGPVFAALVSLAACVNSGGLDTDEFEAEATELTALPTPFVAYNDLAWFPGQRNTNITTYTTGSASQGRLVDHRSGSPVDVVLTITGGGPAYADQGRHPAAGSDAHAVFEGKVDGAGTVSYGTADLTLAFSGLDPRLRYEVVVYGDRGMSSYTGASSRGHFGTLRGARSFVNASTRGTYLVTDFDNHQTNDTTLYNAGYNSQAGLVTRFIDVDPDADGAINIRLKQDLDGPDYTTYFARYYSYANAVMIRGYLPGSAPFIAYNDLAWSVGQPFTNITTYTTPNGAGGGNSSGRLRDFQTGAPVGVTLSITGGERVIAAQGRHPLIGTDAYNVFNGKVDGTGTISYGADDLVLQLAGLDPTLRYEVAVYTDRGEPSYTGENRRGHWGTLTGARSFRNASTVAIGTARVTDPDNHQFEDTALYNAGYNTAAGFLTRFVDIDPDIDGRVAIRINQDRNPSTFASYFPTFYSYANAMMIRGYRP